MNLTYTLEFSVIFGFSLFEIEANNSIYTTVRYNLHSEVIE